MTELKVDVSNVRVDFDETRHIQPKWMLKEHQDNQPRLIWRIKKYDRKMQTISLSRHWFWQTWYRIVKHFVFWPYTWSFIREPAEEGQMLITTGKKSE